MAPPLKKQKVAKKPKGKAPAPAPDGVAAEAAAAATSAGGAPTSTPVKVLVPAAVDPAEVARQAEAAAQEAAAAAAAAATEAAAVALKAARKTRRAERKVEKRAAAAAADVDDTDLDSPNRGVLYIGHLPHGFYEEQLRGFFSQFGTVQRVKVARSRKSGRPKGYAFLQFANVEVARIAADTMDGYLIFGRLLEVRLVPTEQQHERLWVNSERAWRVIPWRAIEKARHNGAEPVRAAARRTARVQRRAAATGKRLAAAGIEYEVPAPVLAAPAVPAAPAPAVPAASGVAEVSMQA